MRKTNKYWYDRLNEDSRRTQLKKDQRLFLIIISIIGVILAVTGLLMYFKIN